MVAPIPRVSIIGDGAMGTLCALLLSELGSIVTLWGRDPQKVASMQRDGENRRHLPGFEFPKNVTLVCDPSAAFPKPGLIVSAVPCQFIRPVWMGLAPFVPRNIPIVSVTKGIEVESLLLPTAILRECVGPVLTACLSGPSIAPEIAAKKPASVVVASDDPGLADMVQHGFSSSYFRVYTSRDRLGVELAGAVKNVIAIAAGLCDGIGAGDNAKAALLTRGLVEISRLGLAMEASAETFHGLAGVGDLFTTCVSKIGRNRTAGERIGRGETVGQVVESTDAVIEGVATTRSVLELAQRHGVEMPIVSAVASVLFGGRPPAEAIEELMTRPLRSE